MNIGELIRSGDSAWPGRGAVGCAPARRPACADFAAFSALASAYRRCGGLACGDELLRLAGSRIPQPISALARRIVSREVISLSWQSVVLLPMFQFELPTMSLREGPRRVLLELDGVFDDWELARWFVEPNCWLADAAPIDRIDNDLPGVLQAARADRFIARG
jgi:hypothetical protein